MRPLHPARGLPPSQRSAAGWPEHVALALRSGPGGTPAQGEANSTLCSLVESALGAHSFGVRFVTISGWAPPPLPAAASRWQSVRGEAALRAFECIERSLVAANVRLQTMGDVDDLSTPTRRALENLERATAAGTSMTLTLAIAHPDRCNIVEAARALATRVRAGLLLPEEIDGHLLREHMGGARLPEVDLLIRSEQASSFSDFLPFELGNAYSVALLVPWSRFRAKDLALAVHLYRRARSLRPSARESERSRALPHASQSRARL